MGGGNSSPSPDPRKGEPSMNLKISYKHLQSTAGIDEVTKRKSEKLKKYFQGKLNLDWNFAVEKHAHIAHCHLTGDHIEFFAEATTENLYAAIDEVIHHLERQVKKNKEQVRIKKGSMKEFKAA
jgi:putative sigma-54 modulation protein